MEREFFCVFMRNYLILLNFYHHNRHHRSRQRSISLELQPQSRVPSKGIPFEAQGWEPRMPEEKFVFLDIANVVKIEFCRRRKAEIKRL